MTAHGFAELLSALGVERSYSRPRVSNDNPYSESAFHTAKYQPDYPGRFADIRQARRWCEEFFAWYNDQHHHSGLALFTPADVFHGRVEQVALTRQAALDRAFEQTPERFVAGPPRVHRPSARVLINPADTGSPLTAEGLAELPDEQLAAPFGVSRLPEPVPLIDLPDVLPSGAQTVVERLSTQHSSSDCLRPVDTFRGHQFAEFGGWVGLDRDQYGADVVVRIDRVQPAGSQDGLDHREFLSVFATTGKHRPSRVGRARQAPTMTIMHGKCWPG